MQNTALIETTVEGLGYAFVEAAWPSAGLLRVTIDHLEGGAVTVDDCERVTRQLQYALEVDGQDYRRLEVSSPGLDRLLRTPGDFARFAESAVDVNLRVPFKGRKKYRGVLQQPQAAEAGQVPEYVIVWDAQLLEELAGRKPGVKGPGRLPPSQRAVKVAKPAAVAADELQELRFSMAEVREVRLVPVIDFRGRKS
jgi:ribosome maturation factor RimP